MRAIFALPPLIVASAALGGLLAPFAVGSVPTDRSGIATANDLPFGANAPICRGSASHGATGAMMRLAQARTEVPPAEMQAAVPAAAFADTDPPLWEGLGAVTYKITTANEQAQSYFDQGLRLTYAFNHGEAQRAFRKAQKLDPDCAMCFWGEALVLGPNINLPMQDDAVAPAFAAAEKARGLAAKATPREQALIAAVATRYAKDAKADRAPLDAAYAAAMGKVAAQFPDDNEIAVLYAESVMDLSPWNYWQPGGRDPNPQSGPIVPTLERVLARDPNHPGAIHYYIHAVEASRPAGARRALCRPAARRRFPAPATSCTCRATSTTGSAAISTRWPTTRRRPKWTRNTWRQPMRRWACIGSGYYPHNVHFVLASAQMAGDGPTVIAAAEKLRGLIPDEVARVIALVQPVKAAPYFAHALFSPPATVLALPDPGDAIPYVKAMWHYARGIAFAAQGDFAAAKAEASAIAALEGGDFTLLNASGVPAKDVLTLARTVIEARIAQRQGDKAAAIERFERAAALQDGLPYMEPPYWYYPVRQSLAVALMQAGRLDDAEEQFQHALKRAPGNGWSWYGLAELYKARGKADEASKLEADLAKLWIGERQQLDLSKL